MKRILIALCASILTIGAFASRASAIVNGHVVNIGNAPYNVALLWKGVHNPYVAFWCGGTIVAPDWVLTAAHCVTNAGSTKPYGPDALEVGVGRTNLHSITQSDRHAVTEIILHPQWLWVNEYDVALMHLATPVPQAWVLPLNRDAAVPAAKQTANAYGWGTQTANGNFLPQLHGTTMPLKQCGPSLPLTRMICAGGLVNGEVHNVCSGDSGGPFVVDGKLAGVTSRGFGSCSGRQSSAGFIRVSAMADWIRATAHV